MVLREERLSARPERKPMVPAPDMSVGATWRRQDSRLHRKRSLYRAGSRDQDIKQVIGLEPIDPKQAIVAGCHLLIGAGRQPPAITDGWVTSACYSPNLGRHIALAVLRGGQDCEGEVVTVINEKERFDARVVPSVFFDPADERLNG
jgi:sarcosine oxidase subunit alpha